MNHLASWKNIESSQLQWLNWWSNELFTKRFSTVLSIKLETAFFCHSLAETGLSDWFSCAHDASWTYLPLSFHEYRDLRNLWLNHFLLFYLWSTCQQYRCLVSLLYDGILRNSAGQSPHIQCFLTLPCLSWTTTANYDMEWVCLGYMSILISSLSDASAWKENWR